MISAHFWTFSNSKMEKYSMFVCATRAYSFRHWIMISLLVYFCTTKPDQLIIFFGEAYIGSGRVINRAIVSSDVVTSIKKIIGYLFICTTGYARLWKIDEKD